MSKRNSSAPSKTSHSRSSRRLWVGAATVFAALATAFALSSLAEARPGWLGGHGESRHGFDRERAHDHAEYAIGWALRSVDASDEQTAQIGEIVDGVIDQMAALREPHGEHRDAFVALLAQESIDRGQLEVLRAEELALAETASSLLGSAIADIAETLTQEQRAILLEHAGKHRGRHGWH
jgi:protein CpxP